MFSKKLLSLFFVCAFLFLNSTSLVKAAWEGTYQLGSTHHDEITRVEISQSDEIFLAGRFTSNMLNKVTIFPVDLDVTSGVYQLKTPGLFTECDSLMFVSKYNSDGSHVWSRGFGKMEYDEELGTDGNIKDIVTDTSSNVYILGAFEENAENISFDFDGTSGVDEFIVDGDSLFLTKYNSDGSYGWTRIFKGSGGGGMFPYEGNIAVDNLGNIYATGLFEGTIDFDGTGGIDNHTSNGEIDIFITKYNTDGSYGWTRTFGNAFRDGIKDIEINNFNEIFIIGDFEGTIDFDGTGGIDNHTSEDWKDIFLTKYNSDGSYGWTRTFGEGGANEINIYDNKVYVSGKLLGTANFDGTGGIDNHSSNGSYDLFIAKYNFDGTYDSTTTFGDAESEEGYINIEPLGNIIVVGSFEGTKDLDDTKGIDNYTSNGKEDIFITKYNVDGSYRWTRVFGGKNRNDYIKSSAINSSGDIFVSGAFMDTVDFDGTSGVDIREPVGYNATFPDSSDNDRDGFVTKYNSDGSYGDLYENSDPLYRFWSDEYKGHFYTASEVEKDSVIINYADNIWKYEGIAYDVFINTAYVSGTVPVYRFWSDFNQGHFYTASETERDTVITKYDDYVWKYERKAFYVYPNKQSNTKPVYRFWSNLHQHHFYTASEKEKNNVINNYPDNVWKYEGIAWYVPE